MACLTRTEDVRTARGDNHCSEQVLLKILMLACVGYFIAWTRLDANTRRDVPVLRDLLFPVRLAAGLTPPC